ncbi:beta strand repeat-containing protein, partial [Hymenobacter chitinivorans]
MQNPLPHTGKALVAGSTWRPLLTAALGLSTLVGAQAQTRDLALPIADKRMERPASAASPARVALPAKTLALRQVQAEISSTATGGNWSDPTTWVGGVVPTAADNVTIVAGATVTLDVAGTCGNLTVAATGSLLTSATTAYVLQVAGSITNNGTLDLSASSTIGSDLRFTGAGNAAFTGTGTTDLQTMSLAKSVRADIVEMALPSLSVKGSTTATDGFLSTRTTTNTVDDMTGTLKISGTNTVTNRVFSNAASYVIPVTGGFWLNNPNFTVASQTGSPVVNGLLRISTGTFNVGNSIGNSINFGTGSVYTMEGGTLSTVGRFTSFTSATAAAAMTFTLSGGTINVATVGNTSGTPSFGVNGTTTISGGTINLVQRSTATTPLDYYVAGTYTYTGGTVNVGVGATATNFDFRIRGTFPNLNLDNTNNAKTAVLQGQTNVYGTTLITAGANLNLNGLLLLQLGATITNNGTLTGTATGSTLYFAGSVPQTIGGTGTATTIRTLTVDNNGGGATLNMPLVVTRVNMFTGNLNGTNNLTIGDGSAIFFVIQLGVTANTGTSGSFASAPTFNIGTGALQLIYAPEITNRTTGFEIPASRVVDVITIGNPAGVTLAGGPVTVPGVSTASLILTSGVLTTSAANTLVLGPSAGAIPTGSATSYVKGPLGITVNSATAVSRTFAVGDAAGWRPVVVGGITTSANQVFTATVINGTPNGSVVAPVSNLNPTRYVRLENSANLPATATVQLSYGTGDIVGNAATAVVAQAPSANGPYASIGGTAVTTPATGLVSTLNLTPGNDFFVLANTEGGSLTSSVSTVCAGANSGTITLTGYVGTIVTYEFNTGSGFTPLPTPNNTPTLTFSNLTTTTTIRAVILTADGRQVNSAPITITVNPTPTATLTASTPTTFCGSGTLTLNATPVAGATYQYQLNGTDIAGATSATYTTTATASGSYTVIVTNGGCSATSAAVAVTVNPATSATFSYSGTTFCVSGTNPTATVTGTTGGTFSSAAGLSLNATTGAINLAASTPGTYTVTYSVGGTCPSSATASVTITAAPVASFSYAATSYCTTGNNPAPVVPATSTAGTFSSAAGLSLNATTGVINLAASTPGTYTITNTVAASGGCTAVSATASVTITAPATAGFSYAAGTYCAGSTGSVTPTLATGASAGSFSSTTGLSLNASTGAINLAASAAGTYTVTNTV